MSSNPFLAPVSDSEVRPSGDIFWILFQFDGRIPRRTYWASTIGTNVVFFIAAMLLLAILGEDLGFFAVMLLYIPLTWASLALQIKRWHDRDKSGWWFLINFVPVVGGIWSFIEVGCLRGTVGSNAFGPDPG